MTSRTARSFLGAALLAAGAGQAAVCDMALVARHTDPKRTPILAARSGPAALFFTADLDVNTDGSARSYHPDDPRGRTKALNNIANAIQRIHAADGTDITCAPRRGACFTRFITTFEAARDAGWARTGAPRVSTDGIIPWQRVGGRRVPCTIAAGPHQGFFVSQTALAADPTRDACDQERYLDSLAFNAIVVPRGVTWSSQGRPLRNGDLVAVRHGESGRTEFAVVGDRGPANAIGEGTVRLAAQLAGRTLDGSETYPQIRALAIAKVHYLAFPAQNIQAVVGPGQPFTQDDIDRAGAEALAAWGGEERLAACAAR
jgi:hypothetical protein